MLAQLVQSATGRGSKKLLYLVLSEFELETRYITEVYQLLSMGNYLIPIKSKMAAKIYIYKKKIIYIISKCTFIIL